MTRLIFVSILVVVTLVLAACADDSDDGPLASLPGAATPTPGQPVPTATSIPPSPTAEAPTETPEHPVATPEPTASVPPATPVAVPTATPLPATTQVPALTATPLPAATQVPTPMPTQTPTAVPAPTETPPVEETVTPVPFFLTVTSPEDETTVTADSMEVTGETTPDAVVSVNGEPVEVDASGNFTVTVELVEGPNFLEVVASDFAGNEVQEIRAVIYLPE